MVMVFFDIRLDHKRRNYSSSVLREIEITKDALKILIKRYQLIEQDMPIKEPEKKNLISKGISNLSVVFSIFKKLFKKPKTDTFNTIISDQDKFDFIFTFWLTSIKKEVDFAMAKLDSLKKDGIPIIYDKLLSFMKDQPPDDNSKKIKNEVLSLKITLSYIFPEFLSMIEFSSPFEPYGYEDSKTSKTYRSNFDILIFYQLSGDQCVYIGSIFYKCWNQPGWEYSLGNFTDGNQKWMFFVSIYKSLLNDCAVCTVKKYHKFMLDKVESIARNKDCKCEFMGTIPLGIMGNILLREGFSFNYTKLLPKTGGKKTKPNRSITGKKLNKSYKTNNKSKRKHDHA
jgi:hypothetical protein